MVSPKAPLVEEIPPRHRLSESNPRRLRGLDELQMRLLSGDDPRPVDRLSTIRPHEAASWTNFIIRIALHEEGTHMYEMSGDYPRREG